VRCDEGAHVTAGFENVESNRRLIRFVKYL